MSGRTSRWLASIALAALTAAGCAPTAGSSSDRLVSIGAGLEGPAGLRATIAAQGLIHASALAMDDQGRLWVATAALDDKGTDGVYVVPSRGATPIQVLSGVHTPLGLLWLGGSLYVASSGRVEVESGFDGTRFASSRTILQLPAGTGEDNGLALLPDGRIAMGISAPCDHCTPTLAYSASVVLFRPDGSDLQVQAKGIRAPVGLAVDPRTNDLLVTMDQRDDLGEATPGDWLGVVRPGQDWGFPDCYGQAGAACSGAPAPSAVLDQHAAVSGVAVAPGPVSGSAGTVALVAEWNTGKVLRVDLGEGGAAAAGTVVPFLTGFQRPEPLLTTPGGSVLVGDWATGTVYEITAPAA